MRLLKHDIIQQTIYELIPEGNKKLLHRSIGTSLLQFAANNPTIHLLAVDQINLSCKDMQTITMPIQERSTFAQANVTAAKMAIASSSFEQGR